MRSVLAAFTWLTFTAVTSAGDQAVNATYRADLAAAIDEHVARQLPGWNEFFIDLHRTPELSLHEKETSRKTAERLEKAGYRVTRGVGGYGVVGLLENGPGPTILIRGDMDALPITEETGLPYASKVTATTPDGKTVGVMHACGHDMHQTCLVGAAETLMALRDRWSGTLLIVAQPAEEIGMGALMMIKAGIFEKFPKPDFAIALHTTGLIPAGSLSYTSGWALANVDSVDITIFGRGGHGSRPQETIDPIVAAAHVVTALQTVVSRRRDPIEPGVVTVGSIHAGSKHNIIPDEAKLQITVRSYAESNRRLLLDSIRDITTHTCRAMGCVKDPEITIREEEFTPATYNDPELTAAAVEVLKQVVGPDRIGPIDPQMGGEDFGRFPRAAGCPGFIFWLGGARLDAYEASKRPDGPPLAPAHSSRFNLDPQPTITTGVRGLTSLALALLSDAPAKR